MVGRLEAEDSEVSTSQRQPCTMSFSFYHLTSDMGALEPGCLKAETFTKLQPSNSSVGKSTKLTHSLRRLSRWL